MRLRERLRVNDLWRASKGGSIHRSRDVLLHHFDFLLLLLLVLLLSSFHLLLGRLLGILLAFGCLLLLLPVMVLVQLIGVGHLIFLFPALCRGGPVVACDFKRRRILLLTALRHFVSWFAAHF